MHGPEQTISQALSRSILVSSRLILNAGFGGLLILMAFAAFDGMQALRQIQSSNDTIREGYLRRTPLLERIRIDLYVSGTYLGGSFKVGSAPGWGSALRISLPLVRETA